MSAAASATATVIRNLVQDDLEAVVSIDALQTGERKPEYWRSILGRFLDEGPEGRVHVGLGALDGDRMAGFLCGEVRAFEFGSEPCGWIFAVAVHPGSMRRGIATALVTEACRRFREAGIGRIRTMVRRNDLTLLSFFRAGGFEGGGFVQLELDLDGGHR